MMNLNKIFDAVYLINLPKEKGRLEQSSQQFKLINSTFEVIKPVSVKKQPENKNDVIGWNKEAKSLQETTKEIIKKAIENKYDSIIIFEDDCYFDLTKFQKFLEDFPKFNEIVKNFDFIHLNFDNGYKFSLESYYGFKRTLDGVLRCQCYILDKSVFEIYLKELEEREEPIDYTVKRIQATRRQSFVYFSKPVSQKVGEYSTIRKRIVNY